MKEESTTDYWLVEDYDEELDQAPKGDPDHDCTGEPDETIE